MLMTWWNQAMLNNVKLLWQKHFSKVAVAVNGGKSFLEGCWQGWINLLRGPEEKNAFDPLLFSMLHVCICHVQNIYIG